MTAIMPRYECPDRRRSFLDRFRGPRATWHQPQHGSSYRFDCEWPEFPGFLFNHEANDCVHCRQPIVRVVGDVWGVRWEKWWADERDKNGRSTTVEMICLEDDEDGEHVCYLPLGHDGEHVWTPFGNGREAQS